MYNFQIFDFLKMNRTSTQIQFFLPSDAHRKNMNKFNINPPLLFQNTSYWSLFVDKKGSVRDLNPGPLAP